MSSHASSSLGRKRGPALSRFLGLALILSILLVPASAVAQDGQPQSEGGYYYVVQQGDTWYGIAWYADISIEELQAANPTVVHFDGYLWEGDRLFIPTASASPPDDPPKTGSASGRWYQVKQGDTWYSLSRETGVSVLDLWHANPTHMHPYRWLETGHRVWVPGGETPARVPSLPRAGQSAAAASPVPTVNLQPDPAAGDGQPSASLLVVATPVPTIMAPQRGSSSSSAAPATPSPTKTSAPTAKPTAKPTAIPTVAPTATTEPPPPASTTETAAEPLALACPAGYTDYPDAILAYLDEPDGTAASLALWLAGCGAITDAQGGVVEAALTAEESADVAVAFSDPAADTVSPRSMLVVYHDAPEGYQAAYEVEGAGFVGILKAEDINQDGQPEVVWTDTTCGAHTCFSTLFVDTWDGEAYTDWIEGTPTMAYAVYDFTDIVPGGSGDEILAQGGVIGSAGAGPQRPWTETYVSPEGAPYTLFNQVYDPSTCLYHQITDANLAFERWASIGFGPAVGGYQLAISDDTLEACGTVEDELVTLRDFARFRLIVAHIANAETADAETLRGEMSNAALLAAADTFLQSYEESASVVQACRNVTAYAEANPDSWRFLADWGYANPTFTAEDLCPLG